MGLFDKFKKKESEMKTMERKENLNFKFRTEQLIELMINTIADKEYVKLMYSIPPQLSWASYIDAEETIDNACLGFGKWLDEQLATWEEDEDKKFVVDHFEKSCIEDIDEDEFINNQKFIVTYNPTSFGEQLDIWFEVEFFLDNGEIKALFDVNI